MAPFHFVSVVFTLFCCARADIITVTFNDPVAINCSDNKVIEIVNMAMSDNVKMCLRDSCNVTVDDKKAIQQKCNGHSSCNISSHLETNCLPDYGYFSFDYTCQDISLFSCDFEQGVCGWTAHNDSTDSAYIWESGTADKLTSNNGPNKDHTLESSAGTYIYTDTTKGSDKDKTYFSSKFIQPSRLGQCLTFWYYMYGNDGSTLSMYHNYYNYYEEQIHVPVKIWSASKSKESKWNYQVISLPDTDRDYRVGFEAVRGQGTGFIAVDDIIIASRGCYVSEQDCNFETDSPRLTRTEGNYQWEKNSGTTLTPKTGPKHDHTTGLSDGTYAYLNATGIQKGTEADLILSPIQRLGYSCLTFWYHMYGKHMGKLRVYKMNEENKHGLWNRSGNQENYWHQAFVDIYSDESYKIAFKGIRGTGSQSDIAIDDIYFIPKTCSEFKGDLSHLTIETQETPSDVQSCINIGNVYGTNGCSNDHVQFYKSNLAFHPGYEECKNVYDGVRDHIETSCSNMRPSASCTFNYSHVLQHIPACFMSNSLLVEYACKDLTMPRKEAQSQDGQNTAVTGGIIAGVIILACAVAVLIFVLRRSQHCKREPKPQTKLQNNTGNLAAAGDYRSDYTGNQDIALPHASGHAIQFAIVKDVDQQYGEIGSIRNEEHMYTDIDKMTEEQTRPQYEYVDSEINGCIKRNKQNTSNVNCYLSSKDIDSKNNKSPYSFAKDDNLESNITGDYAVLDPNETGFNRSNVITDVAIDAHNKPDRSTNMENDLTTKLEDQYDVSNDGTYDASNNNRHKEAENNVYSHTVDNVYDTSSHKRAEQENENAYDHFFEDRSADDKA